MSFTTKTACFCNKHVNYIIPRAYIAQAFVEDINCSEEKYSNLLV